MSWWIAGGLAGLVVFGLLLAIRIVALVRLLRHDELLRVPLERRQVVSFDSPGRVVMHAEGPTFTTGFAGLDYALVQVSTGQGVSLQPDRLRSSRSALKRSRVSLRLAEIPRAGDYELTVSGISDDDGHDDLHIAFTRNQRGAATLHILAIVGTSLAVAASLASVILGLALAG